MIYWFLSLLGNFKNKDKNVKIIENKIPKILKVERTPNLIINSPAIGAVKKGESPKPSSVKPTANPFFSENHSVTTAMGIP